MTDDALERARLEAAELLRLDPDRLSAGDRLRCELISALRSVVDDELGKVDRANAADLSRLIVAQATPSGTSSGRTRGLRTTRTAIRTRG